MKYCIAIGAELSPTVPLPLAGDYLDNIKLCHHLGYHAVEIHTPSPENLPIQQLREVCEDLDMSIATIGTGMLYGKYGMSLMDPNASRREEIVKRVRSYIDIAAQLKSRVTIGSIKGNVPKDGNREQHIAWLAECLQQISQYAMDTGIHILLEATNRYENNVLNTSLEIKQFIEVNELKQTLILLDSFHINIEEKKAYDCLRDAGNYLGHIHFADNTRWYPGSGSFNFDAFCESVRAIGYQGILSVEALPLPDSKSVAQHSIDFFHMHFA